MTSLLIFVSCHDHIFRAVYYSIFKSEPIRLDTCRKILSLFLCCKPSREFSIIIIKKKLNCLFVFIAIGQTLYQTSYKDITSFRMLCFLWLTYTEGYNCSISRGISHILYNSNRKFISPHGKEHHIPFRNINLLLVKK